MSRFLILIYDAERPYQSFSPEQWGEVFGAHQRFVEQVSELGGEVVATAALQPTGTATSFRPGAVTVGPFVQTTEAFCGYYLIEAGEADARAIAALCPARFGGVELRPIMETPSG